MLVKMKELKLNASEVYDYTRYPANGLFLVDDGVAYYLTIMAGGTGITSIIEREWVEVAGVGERDVDLLQKQLSELNKGIADVRELSNDRSKRMVEMFSELKNSIPNQSSSEISLDGLTKMIAVAQKPELINGKGK